MRKLVRRLLLDIFAAPEAAPPRQRNLSNTAGDLPSPGLGTTDGLAMSVYENRAVGR